ncbi:putative transcriptional regulator [Sinomicrobium oceani]|uniref:Putative transcriptional regulator n=1 Tax=Sinomicrobium oceani TaxID=1150368 RepID=A0A1K1M698_9FLAO|nr:YqgE/AlgH family protein [Sinomicrobium oceani]SFW18653.1 putative transcriptional regulator [Sinomicrobium oceani]
MIALKPQKGHLLIAEPSIIGDVSFNRSVVLLAAHNDEGSIGFILNKPLSFRLHELVPEITRSFKIYNGGPVEQDNLYFIHRVPQLISNSIEISNGIYWGGDFDVLTVLLNDGTIKNSDIKFFLGYSGWDTLQLDKELQSNSWIVSENTYKSKVIRKAASSFWKEKMVEFGGDYLLWSNAPENPNLN